LVALSVRRRVAVQRLLRNWNGRPSSFKLNQARWRSGHYHLGHSDLSITSGPVFKHESIASGRVPVPNKYLGVRPIGARLPQSGQAERIGWSQLPSQPRRAELQFLSNVTDTSSLQAAMLRWLPNIARLSDLL
jgi:hypothetical protein